MTSPVADGQAVLIIPTYVDPSAPLVRLWVAAAIEGVPVMSRLMVTLVVDELVSNARRQGGSPCVLLLSLDDTRRFLFVYVDDSAAGGTASWALGAGLTLVRCSTCWSTCGGRRGRQQSPHAAGGAS